MAKELIKTIGVLSFFCNILLGQIPMENIDLKLANSLIDSSLEMILLEEYPELEYNAAFVHKLNDGRVILLYQNISPSEERALIFNSIENFEKKYLDGSLPVITESLPSLVEYKKLQFFNEEGKVIVESLSLESKIGIQIIEEGNEIDKIPQLKSIEKGFLKKNRETKVYSYNKKFYLLKAIVSFPRLFEFNSLNDLSLFVYFYHMRGILPAYGLDRKWKNYSSKENKNKLLFLEKLIADDVDLDYSEGSLIYLSKLISNDGVFFEYSDFYSSIVPIIWYVGEVYIKQYGGKWAIKTNYFHLGKKEYSFEYPIVLDEKGKDSKLTQYIFENLYPFIGDATDRTYPCEIIYDNYIEDKFPKTLSKEGVTKLKK